MSIGPSTPLYTNLGKEPVVDRRETFRISLDDKDMSDLMSRKPVDCATQYPNVPYVRLEMKDAAGYTIGNLAGKQCLFIPITGDEFQRLRTNDTLIKKLGSEFPSIGHVTIVGP